MANGNKVWVIMSSSLDGDGYPSDEMIGDNVYRTRQGAINAIRLNPNNYKEGYEERENITLDLTGEEYYDYIRTYDFAVVPRTMLNGKNGEVRGVYEYVLYIKSLTVKD